MKKYILISLLSTIFVACGMKSNSSSNDSVESDTETITEDTYAARREGYSKGYDDGYRDGYGWNEHGYSFDDRNNYITDDGLNAYKTGYSKGYDEGYDDGESRYLIEKEIEKKSDWHNWDVEDIEGFYVELEGCENSDQAEDISRNYYEGEYIEEWGRYFAKISVNSGDYKIELGERVSSKLFAIKVTNIFIHFKWTTALSRGDEGVIDVFGSKGEFYEKPY